MKRILLLLLTSKIFAIGNLLEPPFVNPYFVKKLLPPSEICAVEFWNSEDFYPAIFLENTRLDFGEGSFFDYSCIGKCEDGSYVLKVCDYLEGESIFTGLLYVTLEDEEYQIDGRIRQRAFLKRVGHHFFSD